MTPINRSELNPFGMQAEADQYFSSSYLTPQRLSSVGYQYQLCLESKMNSFIEIGAGNNLLSYLLKKANREVYSVDIMDGNRPDVLAQLPYLPFQTNSFDISLCFQVLEHLPLSMFDACLHELNRVSRNGLILSLPDRTKENLLPNRIKHFFYKSLRHPISWRGIVTEKDPEHFWEIGIGISYQQLVERFKEAGFITIQYFSNRLFPYHRFYILGKDL